MEPPCDAGTPVVDPAVLRQLRAELDADEAYCKVFVRNYLDQLPRRVSRLRCALISGDLEAAMDAVLSLKTSSRMVGACCLGAIADEVETALKHVQDQEDSTGTKLPRLERTIFDRIEECSSLTLTQLSAENAA
ncbi:Hpt domain-containing protein [Micrococcaceae bacterium Sec5.7]